MTPCKCIKGAQCDPMPNRFRKVLQPGRWWPVDERLKGEGSDTEMTTEEAAQAQQSADAAIAAEYGAQHSSAWCQNMQPVVIRTPA